MKFCTRCKQTKPRSEFHRDGRPNRDLQSNCKQCGREKAREFRKNHGPRVRHEEKTIYAFSRWNSHLKRKYHIDAEEFARLLSAQHGRCAVCQRSEVGGRAGRFHVDHDHATGKVRGLLCTRCNQMLGYGQDSPEILESAARYLRSHGIVAPQAAAFVRALHGGPRMIRRRKPLRRTALAPRTKPVRKRRPGPPRRGPMRDEGFLEFLSEEGCCRACEVERARGVRWNPDTMWLRRTIDPAHGKQSGMSSKGPDDEAIPLCRLHHEMQHKIGWEEFEKEFQFSRSEEVENWKNRYRSVAD